MHYLIDGYNLLHQVGLLLGRVTRTRLEAARATLIRHLQLHQHNDPSATITVVFDATRSAKVRDALEDHDGIAVYFAFGREADDLIEDLLRRVNLPTKVTVVSDDRRLQEAARRRRCESMACIAYWETAETRPKVTTPLPVEEAKPEKLTADEIAHWEKEFGSVDVPQDFADWFKDFDE